VLGNDDDYEPNPLTALLELEPEHGTVTFHHSGSFTYLPDAGFTGVDHFTYRASDGVRRSPSATVQITVFNGTPSATADTYQVESGAILSVPASGVLGNDSDPHGEALTAVLVGQPAHGSLVLNSNGSFSYAADPGYSGSDSFTYQASDGLSESNVVAVTIDVFNVPVANFDLFETTVNQTLVVSAAGVLTNDTDSDNDMLSAVLDSAPQHGELTLNANGSFEYIPAAGFIGTDSFVYYAADGIHPSSPVAVFIDVRDEAATLSITAHTDGDQFSAGTEVLVTGRVESSAEVTEIEINGLPLSALDAAGNFFATVLVQPGINDFEVSAKAGLLQSASTTLTLTGTETVAGVNHSHLRDATTSVVGQYGRTSLSDGTDMLYAELAILNRGQYDLRAPLLIGIQNVSNPSVRVRNPDGVTPNGIPYYDFSSLVEGGELAPGDVTDSRTISFFDPQGIRFTYELVVLSSLNVAPSFVSVPDVETPAGENYLYQAQARDVDNDGLTYSLASGPSGMEVNVSSGAVTWSPEVSDAGTHVVVLQVEDGQGGLAQQEFVLTITDGAPNRPPYFTSKPSNTAYVGRPYAYAAAGADFDLDPLMFTRVAGPAGLTVNAAGLVEWTPAADQRGLHSVTIELSDGQGGSATQTYSILVQAETANHAPVIVSDPNLHFQLPGTTSDVSSGVSPARIDLDLAEGEEATRSVSLTVPAAPLASSADIVFVVDESGSMERGHDWLETMVYDLDLKLTAAGIEDNRYGLVGFGYLSVTGGPMTTASRSHSVGGSMFGTAAQFSDAAGYAVAASGSFEDGYAALARALQYDFRPGAAVNIILVTDEDRDVFDPALSYNSILQDLGVHHARLNVVLNSHLKNGTPPSLTSVMGVDATRQSFQHDGFGGYTETQTAQGGYYGSYQPPDGDPVVTANQDYTNLAWANGGSAWDLNQLREGGLAPTAFSRAFVDRTVESIQRQLEIEVVASDPSVQIENLTGALGGFVPGETATFDVKFTGDGDGHGFDLLFVRPGGVVELGSLPVTINNDYAYSPHAVDADGDAITYSLASAPEGAAINETTGAIRWEPPSAGEYEFVVRAADGRGGEDLQQYTVVVTSGSTNQPPQITSIAPTVAQRDKTYAYQVEAEDADGDTLHYSLVASTAPAGMSIDSATGLLSWTPLADQTGAYLVEFKVRDARGGADTQQIPLTIAAAHSNHQPVITSMAPLNVTAGEPYRYNVQASDLDADRLTFDLPVAPPGMAVDPSSGVIVWNPQVEDIGIHTVILRVRDGQEGVDLQSFQVNVSEFNTPPAVTSTAPPLAAADLPYEYLLRAQDPDGDELTFSLSAAPSGMSIHSDTGRISWTPSTGQEGIHEVTVTVDDGRGGVVQSSYIIDVRASLENHSPQLHVSGHLKPSSAGGMKSSHFAGSEIRRWFSATPFGLLETANGERPQDGEDSVDTTTPRGRMVTAADRQ